MEVSVIHSGRDWFIHRCTDAKQSSHRSGSPSLHLGPWAIIGTEFQRLSGDDEDHSTPGTVAEHAEAITSALLQQYHDDKEDSTPGTVVKYAEVIPGAEFQIPATAELQYQGSD
jgi:hypothetical protein